MDAGAEIPFAAVAAEAQAVGLASVAVIATPPALDGAALARMVADGIGDMAWLERTRAQRLQPDALLPGASRLLCVALPYDPAPAPSAPALRRARYAAGADYHRVLRRGLAKLAAALAARFGAQWSWRAAVDSAPVNERTLARLAGLGWIGRNALVISPDAGSYRLLGVLLTTAPLALHRGAHGEDSCGSCHACETRCPTGALVDRRVLSERCISYLTIEHQGVIERRWCERLEGWWFGCDLCQEACPWNRFAPPAGDARLIGRPGDDDERRLLAIEAQDFDLAFAGRPVRRLGFARFRRNLIAALWSLDRHAEAAALATRSRGLAVAEAQARELGLAAEGG